jgi:hypothetical protein
VAQLQKKIRHSCFGRAALQAHSTQSRRAGIAYSLLRHPCLRRNIFQTTITTTVMARKIQREDSGIAVVFARPSKQFQGSAAISS